MKVIGITLCICVGYAYAGGYGGPVGLVSGAGSSSTYNGGFGGQARSNAGTFSTGNNVGSSFVDNSGSDYDASNSGTSGLAVNNAAVSSNGGGFYDSSAGTSGGNVAVVVPSGSVDTGVSVMNLNTNNGLNNIGSQIQFTIQNILRKFGIDMQRNMIRSSSYFQPGQTYVFQTNGSPMDQSQFQDIGSGFMRQSSGMGSMSQSQSQTMGSMGGGAPISIAYKVISQPTAAVAFQVSSPYQGVSQSSSFGSGSGFQSGMGSNVLSGARSSSINVPLGNGASGSVSYSGVQPQITVYTPNQNANAAVVTSNDDSSDDSDSNVAASNSYPAPAPVRTYSAPAPVVKTYSAPAPVVYQAPAPAPVYVAPAPVYRAPAPVYTPAPVDSAPAYDAAPVYTASAYSAPVASSYVAPKKSKVKYAASNNHRSESNSNVAYESENESK